jgi:hypothetical protein
VACGDGTDEVVAAAVMVTKAVLMGDVVNITAHKVRARMASFLETVEDDAEEEEGTRYSSN